MKKWLVEEDELLYERFVATIRKESVVGYFYEHENNYLILGDHYYWYNNAGYKLLDNTIYNDDNQTKMITINMLKLF